MAAVVAEKDPADVEALMACKLGEQTVEAALQEKILVIGENIKIRRFARFEGVCSAYVQRPFLRLQHHRQRHLLRPLP